MYGSIHTHFESQYDTGNNKKQMVKNFIASGAKKVAVTEHGVFSSYEDLKDIADSIKKEAKEAGQQIPEIEIVPGIEGYFEEEASHLILVAKDYEGYLSLCKIISESNSNIVKNKPIITLDNLKRNVKKGHLICTSACIAGPFGRTFGLERMDLEEKIAKLDADLSESGFREYSDFVSEYDAKKTLAKQISPTKKEIADAERFAKKTGNYDEVDAIEERREKASVLNAWLQENTEKLKEAEDAIKKLGKASYKRKQTNFENYTEELLNIIRDEENGKVEMDAHLLLEDFLQIFGKENFFFEIQNHGLKKEEVVYNNVVSFAYRAGHPNFIASNDIHVGVTKDDPSYEDMLLRRNVIKFTRFNTYQEESPDDREYVIKDDSELKEELLKIIRPVEGPQGAISSEEIVNSAVHNVENVLSECHVEFPQNENHYPKFCEDENAEFERRVRKGIAERFPNGFPEGKEEIYKERLEYEIGVIKQMGYAGYHLIVADYLEYGRLLGYLPTEEEIANAPLSIKELDEYITSKNYPRIGYNIGPGRGSAVGSICCYGMGITDIDPIPYGLLFERFLNVERVSMPDIDSDFRIDIREKVIDYCRAKYGAECICQIMTKSFGATKGNLRLAARYLGSVECSKDEKYKALEQELSEVNSMLSSNPEIQRKRENLKVEQSDARKLLKAVENSSEKEKIEKEIAQINEEIENLNIEEESIKNELKAKKESIKKEMDGFMKTWYARADKLSKLYDELGEHLPSADTLTKEEASIVELAETLEGVFTGYGQHAAGTIISGDDLTGIIPLMWNDKKESMETQCTMAQAEAKGLLKMDFLGLNNLNIITEIIRKPTNKSDMDGKLQDYIEREKILKDSAIYRDIFSTGLTQGVFQFESAGMKKMLMDFKPESFEDIILLVAAYRPGPMDYIPEIIEQKWYNKNGRVGEAPKRSITLKNEALESILAPTYGCPIYQEQIMQIFQKMAGYSLGGADIVRRYMSKKKEEPLKKEKQAFIYGDKERGIPGCMALHGLTEKEAGDLFEQMMPFAKYGFNKSHATAYAMVALYTAYLKKYHTADFFRSSLNAVANLDEIPPFVAEMPYFGLEFKPPTMLESKNNFTVEDNGKSIRFGLKYIKSFSEQNVCRNTTVQDFISMNPGISLKLVEKYAQLGMFTECWTTDKKIGRVQGNRHECLRWLKENGELLEKYLERVEKVESLKEAKKEVDSQLSAGILDEEELKALQKEQNKLKNMIDTWTEKRMETASILNQHVQEDKKNGIVKKETPEEILENRKWETEFLSIPFDIEDSRRRVAQCKNTKTFGDLKTTMDKNNGSKTVKIPAVVLSISDLKKTKNNKNYYEVMLMDRNGTIISRRFDSKPCVLDGEFSLMIDEFKYYTCNLKNYSEIKEPTTGKVFIIPDKQRLSDCQTVQNWIMFQYLEEKKCR